MDHRSNQPSGPSSGGLRMKRPLSALLLVLFCFVAAWLFLVMP